MAYYGDNEVLFSPTVNTTVDLTMEIDENSTNDECPSAKAVYDFGQFINSGSDPIVNTKTGEIVTMNDSGLKPLHGLNIYGKTTQAGTPTPDAPIDLVSVGESGSFEVGVCGKNLLKPTINSYTKNGITYNLNDNGSITASGTATSLSTIDFCGNIAKSLVVNKTYKIIDFLACRIRKADGTYSYPNDKFIYTSDILDIYPYIQIESGETVNKTYYPMILLAEETDTSFEPCNKQTLEVPYKLCGLPVESGGNYTDANGQQWNSDTADFENACFIDFLKLATIKTVWNVAEQTNCLRVQVALPATAKTMQGLCTHFKCYAHHTNDTEHFYISTSSAASAFLYIDKSRLTAYDVETVQAWIIEQNIKILYELAQPQFYSFQYSEGIGGMYCPLIDAYEALHTNKPNTTIISADNAGQRVAYVADPKLYIDNKFTELENAILSLGGNV